MESVEKLVDRKASENNPVMNKRAKKVVLRKPSNGSQMANEGRSLSQASNEMINKSNEHIRVMPSFMNH